MRLAEAAAIRRMSDLLNQDTVAQSSNCINNPLVCPDGLDRPGIHPIKGGRARL
jgi:hypothetical protein